MKIFSNTGKRVEAWFLIIISTVFFFLRFPSLFEPNWYGDEGIYQVLGLAMNQGRLLYRDIFDNKPPLLYFLYSLVNSDEFMIRLLSLVFGLFSVFAFFYLSKQIFKNLRVSFFSTALFAILFGLPLIEGNIANAENFMLLPNIIAGILVLKSVDEKSQNKKYKILLLAGLVVGLSFLFKIVGIFDFAAFLVFLFFENYSKKLLDIFKRENIITEIKNVLPFMLGFILPIALVTLVFIFNNAFSYFLKAILFSNIGYVSYGNKLIIPQGLLILKLIILSLFALFIFYKRRVYDNGFVFASLWLAFSLFSAFFSQRPYTHYVLVLLPSVCLVLGLLFVNKNFSRISGVLAISSFIIIVLSFNFYTKTIFYYQNFVSFLSGKENVTSYQKFFDGSTPRDYEIASYVNLYAKKSDNIFIWGNNAQVYKLAEKNPLLRYTVAYHITGYPTGISEMEKAIETKKPRLIIIMPNVPTFPMNLNNYQEKINIKDAVIYEKIL